MEELWRDLTAKADADSLDGDERNLFKKLVKAIRFLAENPKHPGLASHDIEALTRKYGMKVWQSYLENKNPSAGRLFWVYGPEVGVITVIGLERHPESGKAKGYERVALSGVKIEESAPTKTASATRRARKRR